MRSFSKHILYILRMNLHFRITTLKAQVVKRLALLIKDHKFKPRGSQYIIELGPPNCSSRSLVFLGSFDPDQFSSFFPSRVPPLHSITTKLPTKYTSTTRPTKICLTGKTTHHFRFNYNL